MSTTTAVTSSTAVLNPSKSPMRVGINFFQIPVNVDIWPLPMNHKCTYRYLEWWILSKSLFNLLCSDSSEESIVCVCVCVCVCVKSLQSFQLFATLSRVLCPWDFQTRILKLQFPSPGNLPNPGIKPWIKSISYISCVGRKVFLFVCLFFTTSAIAL